MPLFSHEEDAIKTFRYFTSQLAVNGVVKQAEIVRSFGVPDVTVKRYVKLLRVKGSKGFFCAAKNTKRSRIDSSRIGRGTAIA